MTGSQESAHTDAICVVLVTVQASQPTRRSGLAAAWQAASWKSRISRRCCRLRKLGSLASSLYSKLRNLKSLTEACDRPSGSSLDCHPALDSWQASLECHQCATMLASLSFHVHAHLCASSMRFLSSSRFASCVRMWSELMSGQCSGKVSCA